MIPTECRQVSSEKNRSYVSLLPSSFCPSPCPVPVRDVIRALLCRQTGPKILSVSNPLPPYPHQRARTMDKHQVAVDLRILMGALLIFPSEGLYLSSVHQSLA